MTESRTNKAAFSRLVAPGEAESLAWENALWDESGALKVETVRQASERFAPDSAADVFVNLLEMIRELQAAQVARSTIAERIRFELGVQGRRRSGKATIQREEERSSRALPVRLSDERAKLTFDVYTACKPVIDWVNGRSAPTDDNLLYSLRATAAAFSPGATVRDPTPCLHGATLILDTLSNFYLDEASRSLLARDDFVDALAAVESNAARAYIGTAAGDRAADAWRAEATRRAGEAVFDRLKTAWIVHHDTVKAVLIRAAQKLADCFRHAPLPCIEFCDTIALTLQVRSEAVGHPSRSVRELLIEYLSIWQQLLQRNLDLEREQLRLALCFRLSSLVRLMRLQRVDELPNWNGVFALFEDIRSHLADTTGTRLDARLVERDPDRTDAVRAADRELHDWFMATDSLTRSRVGELCRRLRPCLNRGAVREDRRRSVGVEVQIRRGPDAAQPWVEARVVDLSPATPSFLKLAAPSGSLEDLKRTDAIQVKVKYPNRPTRLPEEEATVIRVCEERIDLGPNERGFVVKLPEDGTPTEPTWHYYLQSQQAKH